MVIDPVARALTHLVVEPKHGRAKGHLVPINLVVSTTDGVVLAYTTAEFEKLDEAEDPIHLGREWAIGLRARPNAVVALLPARRCCGVRDERYGHDEGRRPPCSGHQ